MSKKADRPALLSQARNFRHSVHNAIKTLKQCQTISAERGILCIHHYCFKESVDRRTQRSDRNEHIFKAAFSVECFSGRFNGAEFFEKILFSGLLKQRRINLFTYLTLNFLRILPMRLLQP